MDRELATDMPGTSAGLCLATTPSPSAVAHWATASEFGSGRRGIMSVTVVLSGGPGDYDGATIADIEPDDTGYFWLEAGPEAAWYQVDAARDLIDSTSGSAHLARYVGDHRPGEPPAGKARAYYQLSSRAKAQQAARRLAAEPDIHVSRPGGFAQRTTVRVDFPEDQVPNAILREIDPLTRQIPGPPPG
jgi:hypothetical protein